MEKSRFNLTDICTANNIERTFVKELQRQGLIEIIIDRDQEYLEEEQVFHVERYSTWHYELDINMEGLEVVSRLIRKIEMLQEELRHLKASHSSR